MAKAQQLGVKLRIEIPLRTNVLSAMPGSRVPQEAGFFGAVKKDGGTLEATRVNVGRDGITPPM